jgi:hypothetical protein
MNSGKKGRMTNMALSIHRVCDIIEQITYKPGWSINVGLDKDRYYIQVACSTDSSDSLDSVGGDLSRRTAWKGAKHYLSPFMCNQEVVGVAFKAIRDAEEHEMREWFRFRGRSIYNPHLDPEALAALASRKENFVFREDAMSMKEGLKETEV